MIVQRLWQITKRTFSEYSEDNVSRLSAALAYYGIFAIAPLLVIAIAVVGFVFGRREATGQVQQEVSSFMGSSGASAVQTMIHNASRHGSGIIATIISAVILLIGATGVFTELQSSLDTIWDVKPRPAGIRDTIRRRLLTFVMVLVVGLLLLASLAVSTAMAGIARRVGISIPPWVFHWIAPFAISTVMFALVFKVLPDAMIRWRDVWIGAMVTAALFTIGNFLLGLYLARGSVSSVFGAAGSLVAVLVWVYYSAQIMFLGAEFTQVYAQCEGRRIAPSKHGERIAKNPTESAQRAMAEQQPAEYHASVPIGRNVALPREIRPKQPSRMMPLLIGAAIGRYLFSHPKRVSQKKIRKRMKPRREFAPARIVEPGWVSHFEGEDGKQITRVNLPSPLYNVVDTARTAYRKVTRAP